MSLSSVLANRNYSTTWPTLIHYQNYSSKIGSCNFGLCLVVSDFNESWLVVSRSLEAMEVHHGCSNIRKPRGLNVGAELHSRVKAGASNSNRNLQVFYRCIKIQTISIPQVGSTG